MQFVDVICLANSYKKRGRCIAGLRIDGAGWVRLNHPKTLHGELYPEDYTLADGSEPKIFDVIRVALIEHQPLNHHPENWDIADEPWELVMRPASPSFVPLLRTALAQGSTLLGDDQVRIPFSHYESHPATESLTLVEPLAIQWTISKTEFNTKKPRVLFLHGGTWYSLPVTDPLWIPRLTELEYGKHANAALRIADNRRVLLTVSLSEEFTEDGCCYKLVAGIALVSKEWKKAAPR